MADASFWSNDAKLSTQRVVVTGVTGSTVDGADVILVCVKPRFMVMAQSTFNQDVSLVVGEDDFWRFPASQNSAFVLDLRGNQLAQMPGQVFGLYHHGVAPTTGMFQLTVVG